MSTPIKSFGASFSYDSEDLPNIESIEVGESDVTLIDTTSHATTGGYRTYTGGLADGGTVTVSGKYDGTEPVAFDAEDTEPKACALTFSDGSSATFDGVLLGLGVSNPLDDVVTYSASFKISGPVTYAPASGGGD
jgi:hypothetical protein